MRGQERRGNQIEEEEIKADKMPDVSMCVSMKAKAALHYKFDQI
jgi:hypothetical protein